MKPLRRSPLAMLFFNHRAAVLGMAGVFLFLAVLLNLILPGTLPWNTLSLYLVGWSGAVLVTLAFHPLFASKVRIWREGSNLTTHPPALEAYISLDSVAVLGMILFGYYFEIPTPGLLVLLAGNVVVYAAYGTTSSLTFLFNIVTLGIGFSAWSLDASSLSVSETDLLRSFLVRAFEVLPSGGALILTAIIVAYVSYLRRLDTHIIAGRLRFLGSSQEVLSVSYDGEDLGPKSQPFRTGFRNRLGVVLQQLVDDEAPFWYSQALVWFERRKGDETRVRVAVAGPCAPPLEFPVEEIVLSGPSPKNGPVEIFYNWKEAEERIVPELIPPACPKGPVAVIPIWVDDRKQGEIFLFGQAGGPLPWPREQDFLNSLQKTISTSLKESRATRESEAIQAMDVLFELEGETAIHERAVEVLARCLSAEGCQILIRERTDRGMLRVAATTPNLAPTMGSLIPVGHGQTGKCAQASRPIKWDDVQENLKEFDKDMRAGVEDAIETKIHGWLGIPIGIKKRNCGVIKVVNRTNAGTWFSHVDVKVGSMLAARLRVLHENAESLSEAMDARERAEAERTEAFFARDRAERAEAAAKATTKKRERDITTITHQVQGPMSTIRYGLSSMIDKGLTGELSKRMVYLKEVASDVVSLCLGSVMAVRVDAGRKIVKKIEEIDAPTEMKRLAKRMNISNPRPAEDRVTFRFYSEPGFPSIQMDRTIFTNVMYALIHNAIKYADCRTQITLVCGSEGVGRTPTLKVKSLGVPIGQHETDTIFAMFGQGRLVGEAGVRHDGAGLGLWIARALMRDSRGDLTVELSSKEPRLSVFIVHFPTSRIQS